MWLIGYWMEHGGFRPEEILTLSPQERTVWQAIAELNSESRYQQIEKAVSEAICEVLNAISRK